MKFIDGEACVSRGLKGPEREQSLNGAGRRAGGEGPRSS